MQLRIRLLLTLALVTLSLWLIAEHSKAMASSPLPLPANVPGSLAPRGTITTTIYLPYVSSFVAHDFTITGLEVTQSVQNQFNTVSLVANRPTVVRVYAQDIYGNGGPVYVSLTGMHNGVPIGTLQSVLTTISTSPSRVSLSSSVNFTLPANWITAGTLDLVAQVDSTNLVNETNEANNTTSITLGFNAVPALDLKIVPIAYTNTGPGGGYYAPPTSDTVSDWVMRSYPLSSINVSFHAPYSFIGDLTTNQPTDSEWLRLLQEVSSLKPVTEASTVYYALIPLPSNGKWNGSIPAWGGYSWIGNRVATGLNYTYPLPTQSADLTSQLAVHEIGHNFGLLHVAGCYQPASIDPFYPYANGSIGHYGLDTSTLTLYDPSTARDFMTYCTSQWWSDYNYQKLYNDQMMHDLAPVRAPAAQNSLLIRASINAQGAVSMFPIYSLTSAPSDIPGSSDYMVHLSDVSGNVIASYPATVLETSQGTSRGIHMVVPVPSTSVASIRIVRGGVRVAERTMSTTRAPIAVPAIESSGNDFIVRWNAVNVPAIVRYVPDRSLPVTLGVDTTIGELRVDLRNLPKGTGHFEIIISDNVTAGGGRISSQTITVTP